MPETLPGESTKEWACRILMTIDVWLILSGYISLSQTQHQLISPLIPKSTVYEIVLDSNSLLMKTSIISAGLFLVGLWLYSFKKKIPAIIFFVLAALFYELFPVIF